MKKALRHTLIAACLLFAAATASAESRCAQPFTTQKSVTVSDTPYIASVKIVRPGIKDTPYLFTTATPATVYEEVNRALYNERGTFKVSIGFYGETGRLIREEIFLVRRGDE